MRKINLHLETMKLVALAVFVLLSWNSSAQTDSILVFLERCWEKELALQSGELSISKEDYDGNELLYSTKLKLTFYYEPGKSYGLYHLENDRGGTFYSNDAEIEYNFRGFRRQSRDSRYPNFYLHRMQLGFKDLCLGFNPAHTLNRPYWIYQTHKKTPNDTLVLWDPVKKYLSIKRVLFKNDTIFQYEQQEYFFNQDSFLIQAISSTIQIDEAGTWTEKHVRNYSYTNLNKVPYFNIRNQINELLKAPILHVERPEPIETSQYPNKGSKFPNLTLMDAIGTTKSLSSIPGPKILIFHIVQTPWPEDLLCYIDSMEDAHQEWNFFVLTFQSIDDLSEKQQIWPNLSSLYLASKVNGLNMNGWPVWFILDKHDNVLSENHGYHKNRNNEFTEWIKDQLPNK